MAHPARVYDYWLGLSITGVFVRRHGDQPTEREREDVTTMMLYDLTVQYHAERIKTADEWRRADEQLGMMAAEMSRPEHAVSGDVLDCHVP